MDDTTRGRVALLLLAASAIALLATSQAPGTTVSVDGEVVVGPGHPGILTARFEVRPEPGDSVESVHLSALVPSGLQEPRLSARIWGEVGDRTISQAGDAIDIPPSACAGGCTVVLRGRVDWVGRSEPDLWVKWAASLNAVGANYSDVPVSASVVEGQRPSLSSLAWLLIGALLAATSAAVWLVARARFRRLRLAVTALGVIVAVVPLLRIASMIGSEAELRPPPTFLVWDLVLGVPFVALAVGLALAIRAHLRGKGTYLPIVGWVYLVVVGLIAAIVADAAQTYRPHELAALGLVSLAPAAAAITSGSLLGEQRALRIRHWSVLVSASQVVLLAFFGLASVATVPAALLGSFVAIAERSPDALANAALSAVPVLVFVLLFLGFRGWRAGRRGLLVAANALALVPLLFLGAMSVLFGSIVVGRSLLFIVPVALLVLAALVGVVGGLTATAPSIEPPSRAGSGSAPAGGDRGEQAGEHEEVGRVGDETNRLDRGEWH